MLLALSLIVPSIGYTQNNNYCLPIEKARLLVEDAFKKRVLDTVVNTLEDKIIILENQVTTQANDYRNLLKIEADKFQVQKEISELNEGLTKSYKDQLTHTEKLNRRHKRQRNVLGLLVLVAVGGFIVK